MAYIYKAMKIIVFGITILYIYNIFAVHIGLIIPINVVSVAIVGLLGVPGLLSLIMLLIFAF